MKSSRRDLSNDMAEHRLIFENNQNTYYPRFSFAPKTGIAFPKTCVLFLLWRRRSKIRCLSYADSHSKHFLLTCVYPYKCVLVRGNLQTNYPSISFREMQWPNKNNASVDEVWCLSTGSQCRPNRADTAETRSGLLGRSCVVTSTALSWWPEQLRPWSSWWPWPRAWPPRCRTLPSRRLIGFPPSWVSPRPAPPWTCRPPPPRTHSPGWLRTPSGPTWSRRPAAGWPFCRACTSRTRGRWPGRRCRRPFSRPVGGIWRSTLEPCTTERRGQWKVSVALFFKNAFSLVRVPF